MALFDDLLKGGLFPAVAIGAATLALAKLVPTLPSPLRSALKGGVSLLLEAEFEAEGGIVERLAETALSDVLDSLSAPGPDEHRSAAAHRAVETFKRKAEARARRYGRHEADRSARYRRHIHRLSRRIEHASRATAADAAALSKLRASLDDAGSS